MNKLKLAACAVLAVGAVASGALALSACAKKEEPPHDDAYYGQYLLYAEGQNGKGEEALSYEDFLIMLIESARGADGKDGRDGVDGKDGLNGKDGEDGKDGLNGKDGVDGKDGLNGKDGVDGKDGLNGKDGVDGKDGLNGKDGKDGTGWLTGELPPTEEVGKEGDFYLNVSDYCIYEKQDGVWTGKGNIKGENGADGDEITSIAYENDQIVVTLSSGQVINVGLPEELTHRHTYESGERNVIIPPTAYEDGICGKQCDDMSCGHIEFFYIEKRYEVKVVDLYGNAVEGVRVTVNGAYAVTDLNGKAQITGYGEGGNYAIAVEKQGYAIIAGERTGGQSSLTVTIARTFDTETVGDVQESVLREEGEYAAIIKTSDAGGQCLADKICVTLCGDPDEGKRFKLTALTENAKYAYASDGLDGENAFVDGSATFTVGAGERKKIYLSADAVGLQSDGFAFGEKVVYTVKAEKLPLPVEGEKELPKTAAAGVKEIVPSDRADWVYYKWENDDPDNVTVKFVFTGLEVAFTNYELTFDGANNPVYTEKEVAMTSGKAIEIVKTGAYYFRVRRIAGAATSYFTLTPAAVLGTAKNPVTMTLGRPASYAYSAGESGEGKWFRCSVTTAGKYTLVLNSCNGVKIYSSSPTDGSEPFKTVTGGSAVADRVLDLSKGTYWLFAEPVASYDGESDFALQLTLRKYDDVLDI